MLGGLSLLLSQSNMCFVGDTLLLARTTTALETDWARRIVTDMSKFLSKVSSFLNLCSTPSQKIINMSSAWAKSKEHLVSHEVISRGRQYCHGIATSEEVSRK